MGAFQSKEDIGNRALQHCGAGRLDAALGFNEGSRNAAEVSFAYDKCRESELEANDWTCALKRTVIRPIDASTMLLTPGLWSLSSTYFVGSIVADAVGNPWISQIPNNLNNDPLLTNWWEPYYGPLSVSLYAAGSYSAGELVYTTAGDGTSRVYLSLQNGNTDNPATPSAYDATAVYSKNQVVTYLSVAYMSRINLNKANTPSASAAPWDAGTTYAAGAAVAASDGVRYTSVASGNLNNDPTLTSPTSWTSSGVLVPWTTVFTGGTGSNKWVQIGGAEFPFGVGLTPPNLIYPVGSGRNVFKLPAGFLRVASQDPKRTTTWLGGPSGFTYNDWNLENGYLVTSQTGTIPLRFVANITDVRRMHAMFCEGLAARIAMSTCETITQSTTKLGTIAKVYSKWISDAKLQNAIEQGYDDPPDDDFVTCRL